MTRTASQTGPAVAIRAGKLESPLSDDELGDSGCATWTADRYSTYQKNENAEIYIGPCTPHHELGIEVVKLRSSMTSSTESPFL